jgi:hypothetical protein
MAGDEASGLSDLVVYIKCTHHSYSSELQMHSIMLQDTHITQETTTHL